MDGMGLSELRAEKTRYSNLQGAVDNLVGELKGYTGTITKCSNFLGAGGLLIDGSGVDVYSFGGFEQYKTEKVDPIISQLSALSSDLSTGMTQINNRIEQLEEEERERQRREAEEKKEQEDKK